MGAPGRLRMPAKLGFKSARNIQRMSVTNTYPGGWPAFAAHDGDGCVRQFFRPL